MEFLLVILFFAFPFLCLWGYWHYWRKYKKANKAIAELQLTVSKQKTVIADLQALNKDWQVKYGAMFNRFKGYVEDNGRTRYRPQVNTDNEHTIISYRDDDYRFTPNQIKESVDHFVKWEVNGDKAALIVVKTTIGRTDYEINSVYPNMEVTKPYVTPRGNQCCQLQIGDAYIRFYAPIEGILSFEEKKGNYSAGDVVLRIDGNRDSIDEFEKEEIRQKLLAKKKRRSLEKEVLNELIEKGEIFPDANKRPPIPKEVVDAVWNRDGGKCVYCGSTKNLHLDHIIPFSKGGATTVENLQLLCEKCNLQKSNKIG